MWNAKRDRALTLAALAGGVWLAGCKQASSPIQPSIFTNPTELALVCFSTDSSAEDPTLPLDCCNGVLGDDAQAKDKVERCGGWSIEDGAGKLAAASHALVTQVQRGEVAAVNLDDKVVLDSDKRIPGYTFVDVGGLPTAIAVRSGDEDEPPLWTYVAGRESNSVRALATCRFKTGRACGPELAGGESELFLTGEPFDMQLAADERGLWLTLPDQGLLAYIPLPEAANDDAPFAGDPVYYALPGGFDTEPPPPEAEADPYRFACRYDESKLEADVGPDMSDPAPWQAIKQRMPQSDRASSKREARPTLLRMVDRNPRGASDPTRKLLFVADEDQMALHAYVRDAEGNVELVASLPVGAPLRDFAVTPEVPALAPSYARLMSDSYYDAPAETTRYVYAIDQRDGSLMAFSLTFEADVPKLVPLLAPTPARDLRRLGSNRSDRFSLGREQDAQARALDVVDTRLHRRADGSFDDAHCHVDDRDEDRSALESRAASTSSTFERERTPQSWRDALLAEDELSVLTNAEAYSLRGVFLMVATTRGQLSVLDIHDLDLECRAKLQCAEEPALEMGVVLGRHSPRLGGSSVPTVTVAPGNEVAIESSCPDDGYALRADRDGRDRVCVSKDPWLSQNINFSVSYEASITAPILDGVLEEDGAGNLWLKAAGGVDLCARGALAEDGLLVGILSPPDEPTKSGGGCDVTTFDSVPLLSVVEAYRDKLRLATLDGEVDAETLLACYRRLVTFDLRLNNQYFVSSELVGYQHRNRSDEDGTCIRDEKLDERFTSRVSLGELFRNQFLSFTLTAKDIEVDAGGPSLDAGVPEGGAGEDDPDAGDEDAAAPEEEDAGGPEGGAGEDLDGGEGEGDAAPSETEDAGRPDAPERARRREVNPTITISSSTQPVTEVVATSNSGRTDVLPHRVRYFPDNNYLFVVDQASQGLRRFLLRPRLVADADSEFR